jgi:hypothetical protein
MIVCGITIILSLVAICVLRVKKADKMYMQVCLVVMAAAFLGIGAETAEDAESLLKDNTLQRGGKGEADYDVTLEMTVDDEEAWEYDITVLANDYTSEEEEELLVAAWEEIMGEFCGESDSVNEISGPIIVRDQYQDGAVTAEWSFADTTLVDNNGSIVAERIPEEGILTSAWVDLYCGGSAKSESIDFRLVPGEMDRKTRLMLAIDDDLDDQMEKEGDTITLPETVDGSLVRWSEKKTYTALKVLALGAVIAILLPFVGASRRREAEKLRQQHLSMEYPDFVSKLTLLLAAGMTVQGAWRRIASTYEKGRENHTAFKQPAYEEMLVTCRELESGIGEERVYDRFGDRCGQVRYRRLGNLLTQNLKKGSRGLVVLLEKEVDDAFEERKNAAKRVGEEASTKLLFPMILMLGIVLVILIYPAIISFQI